MIEERCIGPDVDRSKISPDAEVSGASYLTGARTAVAAGAVVRDSRLHDAAVEAGAEVIDSIVVAEGELHSHKCDAAGRTVVSGAEHPCVATDACVRGCTLINTSVGAGARVTDTWAQHCQVGPASAITDAKLFLVNTAADVTVTGPTEVSEAYLGHHATIDRKGYYEGLFSSAFRQLKYNESTGRLDVVGVIDLPHVSRYGGNTISSTNSGKLLPQPDGVLKSFGEYEGLWGDPLLSHEQIELGPCCWVAPFTKVVGQSPDEHHSDAELVNDEMTTYVMPFAMAGVDGDLTRGLVMPGELSNGIGPKQRRGGWVFTYGPGLVIDMVARLHEALPEGRKDVADTIVAKAINTAIEMTKAMAGRHKTDLTVSLDEQRRGWPKWIAHTYALLKAHLDADLWRFADGKPTEWRRDGDRWTHPRIDQLLAVAPDALDEQVNELSENGPATPSSQVAVPSGVVEGTGGDPEVSPEAQIAPDAFVGPGCVIGPKVVVKSGAQIWNSRLDDCTIGAGSRIERSWIAAGAKIGRNAVVRSCHVSDSIIGDNLAADAASIMSSQLADQTTVSVFGEVVDVKTAYGTILGGMVGATEIDTYLMSMHMAGACTHLRALPTPVVIDGEKVFVPAVPMLGGGSYIVGTEEAPVEMECCFIGSNAFIKEGCYIGLGCFILGELGPGAGVLPFTVSTGGAATTHQIGGVLGALASTIITHFINWTFQAVGPAGAPALAEMVRQRVAHGIDAINWELARRAGSDGVGEQFARYRTMAEYSEAQLKSGLTAYQRALDSGAWEIAFIDGQLRFTSDKGQWLERSGSAFWQKA